MAGDYCYNYYVAFYEEKRDTLTLIVSLGILIGLKSRSKYMFNYLPMYAYFIIFFQPNYATVIKQFQIHHKSFILFRKIPFFAHS